MNVKRPAAPPAAGSRDDAATQSWQALLGVPKMIRGVGEVASLGEAARDLGGHRVLLVTDPGVRRAGHVEAAEAALRGASLEVHVFDQVEENPTTKHVEAGTSLARKHEVDLLVGLGGGSPMDCCKGINFLLTNGGRMEDYWGSGKATRPMLPSIGVPTTAGTGSEAQSFALISQAETHVKMACGDSQAMFRVVILDPALTVTLPREITAISGLDAIGHAVESYVSTRANSTSEMLAREAWKLLSTTLETVLEAPDDLEARGRMQLGAFLAGAAIESSMLGAAHACANPLTANHGVEHGTAVALMLPHVIRFNGQTVGPRYTDLSGQTHEELALRVTALREAGRLPSRLRDTGVAREDLLALARQAAEQWTAGFNPRPVGEAELLELYETAY